MGTLGASGQTYVWNDRSISSIIHAYSLDDSQHMSHMPIVLLEAEQPCDNPYP